MQHAHFLGKAALEKQRDAGESCRIVTIVLDDKDAVPLGNEPVYFEDRIAGKTTSASYGYRVGKPVAIADLNIAGARIEGVKIEVDIARKRYAGRVTLRPAFDPGGGNLRPALSRMESTSS